MARARRRTLLTAIVIALLAPVTNAAETAVSPEIPSAQVEALTRDVEALQATVNGLRDFMERIIACANDDRHYSTELGRCRTATEPDPQ